VAAQLPPNFKIGNPAGIGVSRQCRLCAAEAIRVCNVMHGFEVLISAVAEFSSFEILTQQEVVTVR
jgi:hypothetical protein